jgi:hypothetical protein
MTNRKGTTNFSSRVKVARNHTVKPFGKLNVLNEENGTAEVEVVRGIPEYTFYYLYLYINNITAREKLTETEIIVLSAIMEKPLEFSLPKDAKDNKLTMIAQELSTPDKEKTSNSIYQAAKRLRDKGYLIVNEDQLIFPNRILQDLRTMVKKNLEEKGFVAFDYVFKCVVEGGQDSREDMPADSGRDESSERESEATSETPIQLGS